MQFLLHFSRTLRRLTFRRTALINASWEVILPRLASSRDQLDTLESFYLRDYNPDERFILTPKNIQECSENG